ncbi:MAG: NADH-quinone oxidoreductase subunit J [Steroidobacteraceae bacterium]
MLVKILFDIFAVILVAGALGVIVARNPVHSALALVLTFVTSACIWLLIGAEFLALVLVLVYVGAVMVLFLFVVMMLDINIEELRGGFTRFAWLGWITAAAVIAEIAGVVLARTFGVDVSRGPGAEPASYSNTTELGRVLYTQFAYPFELAAVILLVAIVAAIVLTMRRRPGFKAQDVRRQVAVRPQDRVRIVKMPAESATVTEPVEAAAAAAAAEATGRGAPAASGSAQ